MYISGVHLTRMHKYNTRKSAWTICYTAQYNSFLHSHVRLIILFAKITYYTVKLICSIANQTDILLYYFLLIPKRRYIYTLIFWIFMKICLPFWRVKAYLLQYKYKHLKLCLLMPTCIQFFVWNIYQQYDDCIILPGHSLCHCSLKALTNFD